MNHVFRIAHHVIMSNMTNFHDYKKLIQEQMMHENKFHDKHCPALVTSTRVELKKVVDGGCLFFGDHFADDDAADDEDVATADDDDDDAYFH